MAPEKKNPLVVYVLRAYTFPLAPLGMLDVYTEMMRTLI